MTATSLPLPAHHGNATANGTLAPPSNGESFAKFFECWILQQSRDLAALRGTAAATTHAGPEADADLRRLVVVDWGLGHYEHYYRAKSAAAAADVLPMFSPSWISATETLYLRCGGWRPTAALQLLYSKFGVQLEARLPAFLDGGGLPDGDLGGLSAGQLQAVDELKRRTIRSEQAADTMKMVELAGGGSAEGWMEREMEAKAEGMRRVLEMADALRMDMIRAVVALLRPTQAVHFIVAVAKLHLSVHDFGRRKDAAE